METGYSVAILDGNQDYVSHEYQHGLERITLRDFYDHLTGPLISIVFHIIAIGIVCTMAISREPEEIPGTTAEMPEQEIIPPREMPVLPDPVPETPDVNNPSPNIASNVPADSSEDPAKDFLKEITSMNSEEFDDVIDSPILLKDTGVPLKFSYNGALASRGNIGKGLRENGGTLQTEGAVRKALKWLAEHQNEDGSWGKDPKNQPVFTALAALAFFGHGETFFSEEYGGTLVNAVKRLEGWGEDAVVHNRRYIPGPTYTHPIIVYALAEIYAITHIQKIRRILEHISTPLFRNMNSKGYYSYGYDDRIFRRYSKDYSRAPVTGRYPKEPPEVVEYELSDLSFSAWNYQALKALYLSGIRAEEVYDTIQKAVKGLRGADIGMEKSDYTLTCLGALCLGILGEDDSSEAKRCHKFIKKFNPEMIQTCNWKGDSEVRNKYPRSYNWAIYTWYYQTMALFQMTKGKKSPVWKKWNHAFSKTYTREQERDGSFSSPAQKYGRHLKDGQAAEWTKVNEFKNKLDHAIYCTTFACLTLEVYYRYLPVCADLTAPKDRRYASRSFNDPDFDILVNSKQ